MKKVLTVVGILLLAASGVAAQATSPNPSVQPQQPGGAAATAKIDPAKEADIRRLLEVTGARALAVQMMNEMSKSLKPVLTNSLPPGDYRPKLVDAFFEKFMAKADSQTLIDLAIPEYDKNFTREEILGLIQFYQTPLGKKAVTVLPGLTAQLQEKGKKWGEELGRKSMIEVITEHPEFARLLEEAQKSAQARN